MAFIIKKPRISAFMCGIKQLSGPTGRFKEAIMMGGRTTHRTLSLKRAPIQNGINK
jgi:hypothetical protein